MAADTDSPADLPLGVLAFGDSITNGGGEIQWGVALQSWALWMSRGLGLPYTGYAVDGARAGDVVREQIPAFQARGAHPGARYDVGCLYIGVNDVRSADWDGETFAVDFDRALTFLTARCRRALTCTAPLGLGVPPSADRVTALNVIVRAAAARAGALVVDLSDFGARNHVMADRVHPTAFGQIAIAQRALSVLDGDGLPARVAPPSLIAYETSRSGRLRGDATYAYRSAKQWARALAERARPGHG